MCANTRFIGGLEGPASLALVRRTARSGSEHHSPRGGHDEPSSSLTETHPRLVYLRAVAQPLAERSPVGNCSSDFPTRSRCP
jgi:hypothetical protein